MNCYDLLYPFPTILLPKITQYAIILTLYYAEKYAESEVLMNEN